MLPIQKSKSLPLKLKRKTSLLLGGTALAEFKCKSTLVHTTTYLVLKMSVAMVAVCFRGFVSDKDYPLCNHSISLLTHTWTQRNPVSLCWTI